ncbi:MAG: squalene--hopene cyclase [Desulfuromonadales bacterium]|nr:squalene--hopene cyclase [Desulfuromonadales bacterium]
MIPYKHAISNALTSFNYLYTSIDDLETSDKEVKISHLVKNVVKENEIVVRTSLDFAIKLTNDFFLREQLPAGYWWAELESNVSITSEYIMLFHFLGIVNKERERKMADYLLNKQTKEGFWTIYYGGPGDISITTEAYFALKLSGCSADHSAMAKARAFILEKGGVIKCRVFTKIFLALFGEFPWLGIPSIPIETMLLPNWAYFNMYELSSWSRATIIPLSIVMSERPVKKPPPWASVQELYTNPPQATDYSLSKDHCFLTWENVLIAMDRMHKIYEGSPIRPFKKKAMATAEKWVLDHQESTGDWGGIQPVMLYSVLALHCLGYANNHPAVAKGLVALANFCIENENELVLQSSISPVWDTALAVKALVDSGVPTDHPALTKSALWLLEREARKPGDWRVKSPDLEPGGWAFEFINDYYPDVDDSVFVMLAIKDIQVRDQKIKEDAIKRGITWCLGMQSKNGGWGAYDKDNTKHILNQIPFSDMEALIDPPTADLTGRMLELMGTYGYSKEFPAAARAVEFIRKTQEPEGPWWGRWGVNYIYGSWSVLSGLSAIGEDLALPYIRRAVDWLNLKQNKDGGWGETCESYHDRSLAGVGESTSSQTSWALLSLMATGEVHSSQVTEGISYLISTQRPDGAWDEDHYTGTGFPKFFMIKYHIYRNCFPLMALGTYRKLTEKKN